MFEKAHDSVPSSEAHTDPREDFGVYVPVLLTGQRILTERDGIVLKGNRLQKTTDEHDAHIIAGQNGIPTKMVRRLKLSNTESQLLNGIVVAVKPVHGHAIDLDKLNMEVHDYTTLEALHTSAIETMPPSDPNEPESPEVILIKRQLAIVRALAELSLRV